MYHATDSFVQSKFFQALPLLRTASGSKQNIDIKKQQMLVYLSMQGEDGVMYIPIKGRVGFVEKYSKICAKKRIEVELMLHNI